MFIIRAMPCYPDGYVAESGKRGRRSAGKLLSSGMLHKAFLRCPQIFPGIVAFARDR
jgi:hypothetical protein